MSTRRDLLAFTAGAVAAKTVLPLTARAAQPAHPDAALIALGHNLDKAMAAEQAAWDTNAGDNWTEEGEEHATS